jgi:acyl-CoA synthetase (NDP forming)
MLKSISDRILVQVARECNVRLLSRRGGGPLPAEREVEGVNVSEPAPSLQAAQAKVAALLNPRNVVIVGASDAPGSWALRAFKNLRRYEFPGAVYAVNPRRDQVWNMRCYRGFADLPEPPDHVVVVIPAPQVPETLRAAAAAGARSATIMSSGFGEAEDAAAKALAATLNETIAATGLAVSGPNCMGNIHAPSRLMTLTDDRPHRMAAGPVAIVAQSGGLAMAIKRTLEERGIATASLVTSGNEAGLTTADYIAYYATLPFVRVIVSYLEAVQDPEHLRAACALARRAGKPVIAVKLGASTEGRAAALAHTGAVAGPMEEFDALAASAGILRVRTLDDIVEAVEYFTHVPLPAGAHLGGITFSGALRGLLLDAAAANGLTFSALAPETRRRLEAVLGVGTFIGNPLDSGFAGLGSKEVYIECVSALLDDLAIDILLLQEELPRGPGSERKEANLHAVNVLAARSKKPIVHVTMISHGLTDYSHALREQLPNIGFMQEVDKTLRAVRAIAAYAERARQPV